ncbi:hypothetical protein ACFLYT_01090 [Nanoarchaeota archaeon]
MVWFFKKNSIVPEKINNLHNMLVKSFSAVKHDTHIVFKWLKYLYVKSQEQDQKIQQLQNQLNSQQINVSVPKEQIKEVVDEYYSLDNVHHHINHIHQRLNHMASTQSYSPHIAELQSRLDMLERKSKDVKSNLKEKLIKKITRNSKEYVLNLIISLIRKYEKISALQLKEIVVEEQGLCSKSSFYRILAEIEKNRDITVIKEGKEKLYLAKIVKNS